ncbi:tail tape measure protein [Rhizobium phage RHph_X2_24]|nr:tail tape measure protein [Rhizobium phage RHph_X2_24]
MTDLATIGFRAETAELKEAKASLEALVPAAGKAEASAESTATAFKNTASAAAAGKTAVDNVAKSATQAASGYNTLGTSARNAGVALNAASGAARNAAAANQNLSGSVGGIAAQFNDIGVQLAGGTSPFLIALQQGTQLNQMLGGMGLGATVRALGGAFLSLLNPVSLLTIGVIALGGTAIQYFTEWLTASDETNLSLEKQEALIARVAEQWGAAFPAIQNYNNELQRQKDLQDLIAAGQLTNEQQLDNIRSAFEEIAPEAERLISMLSFEEIDNTKIIDLQTAYENLAERVAAGTATQEDFNAVLEAAQAASASGVSGLESFISTLQSLIGQVGPAIRAVNALNTAISAATNTALNNPATWRSAGMKGQTPNGPIQGDNFINLPDSGPTPLPRGTPELSGFPWEDFGGGRASGGRKSGGGGGSAGRTLTELEKLREGFSKLAEPFNQAKSAYSTLKQAMDNGIITNDQYTQSLGEIQAAFLAAGGTSEQWANVTVASSKKVDDATKFTSDLVKGFASDFRSAIENGASVWEAFAEAGLNAADKLIDRGLNAIIDKLFEVGDTASSVGGATGGGGGLFDWISKGLSWLFSADGNAFDQRGVKAFAKGGSFTNSIVNDPTLFQFANGGALGVMGEAGPEAIMPLKRGPDGSLGVQMHSANGGQQQPSSNNVTVTNQYTIAGAVSEEKLIKQIQATAEQTKKDVRRSLTSDLQQFQRDGVLI